MKITVIPTAKDINKENLTDTVVVVIDVLRATSVIITALYNGAKEVIPVYTLEEAKEYGRLLDVLLGGERGGHKQVGFDFGNSPLEYIKEKVHGKTIVATTTNGTRAVRNSEQAKKIYIGGFLNTKALACYMLYQSTKEDVHILLRQCSHYQYLDKIGYYQDIEYCLQPDIIEIVPEYKKGKIIS